MFYLVPCTLCLLFLLRLLFISNIPPLSPTVRIWLSNCTNFFPCIWNLALLCFSWQTTHLLFLLAWGTLSTIWICTRFSPSSGPQGDRTGFGRSKSTRRMLHIYSTYWRNVSIYLSPCLPSDEAYRIPKGHFKSGKWPTWRTWSSGVRPFVMAMTFVKLCHLIVFVHATHILVDSASALGDCTGTLLCSFASYSIFGHAHWGSWWRVR